MEKVVAVQAYFAPLLKKVIKEVPTGEKKKGFWGKEKDVVHKEEKWEYTGEYSDCEIDKKRLADDLQKVIEELNNEGYSVKTVIPVVSGSYKWQYQEGRISSSPRVLKETEAISGTTGYSYGYGFSYTDCLLVVAQRQDT